MKYEDRMRLMEWVKPEKKDELLLRLIKGERVDITQDADLFYQINVDRMPIEKVMDRDKYKPVAQHAKNSRDIMRGGHKLKYKGEIPLDIWLTHPWFSPMLEKKERDANIEKFFRLFPHFKG